MKIILSTIVALFVSTVLCGQNPNVNNSKFKQLYEELPTPNVYRASDGQPGPSYWQQRADYTMDIILDDENQKITGKESISYTNNSPNTLDYLWLQLDQNVRAPNSGSSLTSTQTLSSKISTNQIANYNWQFEGGFNITSVSSSQQAITHHIIGTMMRIDLSKPLNTGENIVFDISWWYNINNTKIYGGRSGYEPFDDGNNVYCIAQFFPRMCVYNDVDGWQNKQFLGRGEFALPFGDYEVRITVPADHLVSATGTLQNPKNVLSSEQRSRLNDAHKEYVQPVIIQTADEALEASKNTATDIEAKKTWVFHADNVRDFAWASSRRFIWDAMNVKLPNGKEAMAQSMYIDEGKELWEKYSTKAVAHTLKWYSHYTIDYPYPVAWSIDGNMGMEYPMICFNYGRCAPDGTYTKRTKYGHISVIIHEVGHNFFPMIINSDERQWTWMDEGLNTFVQFLTEQHWERNYPSRRGQPYKMVDYMSGPKDNIMPIMTNSESILQFGNNAYGKPATALNILRETVIGPEVFDFAFKKYAQRWAFHHPTPADLFRTLEDASGTDLDWFWRGWFYTTDHVDISLDKVIVRKPTPPTEENLLAEKKRSYSDENKDITSRRNLSRIDETYLEADTALADFYTEYSQAEIDMLYEKGIEERSALDYSELPNLYQLDFTNHGGLVMPIILELTFDDGSTEIKHFPAEIWKQNNEKISKVLASDKLVKSIELDPYLQTADTDRSNNYYPPQTVNDTESTRFEIYQSKQWQFNAPTEMQLHRQKKQ